MCELTAGRIFFSQKISSPFSKLDIHKRGRWRTANGEREWQLEGVAKLQE